MARKNLFVAFSILLLIVPLGTSFQEDTYCSPGSDCSFVFQVRNFYDPGEVYTGLQCNMDFYHPNSSLWKAETMSSSSNGFYNYTLNTEETGTYHWSAECKNTTTGDIKSAKSGIVHIKDSVSEKLDGVKNDTESLKQKNSNIMKKLDNQTKLTMTDFDEVQEGGRYRTKIKAYSFDGRPQKLDSNPEITIYDPERNKIVEGVSSMRKSKGVYQYSYNTSSGMTGGTYETIANISGLEVTLSDYWELESSPAQVKINEITDKEPSEIAANITITNEGNSDYEYQYEYCSVEKETNGCGGGDDLDYASGAKLIQQGESWNPELKLDEVDAEGDLWFKLVVYYGTEKSGASQTFTTPGVADSDSSTESGSSSQTGGGILPNPMSNEKESEISIVDSERPVLLRGEEKEVEATVKNIGGTVQEVSLGIEGLLFQWFDVKPQRTVLQPGETETFQIRLHPPSTMETQNYSFTYVAKGNNSKDRVEKRLTIFKEESKVLRAEVERLKESNRELRSSINNSENATAISAAWVYAGSVILGMLVLLGYGLHRRNRRKIRHLEELFYSEITSQTVSEAREEIDQLEDVNYQKLLEEERESKDRKTMKDYLRDRMKKED